ncbi:DUF4084 domain-containing protein [Peribacillus sp. TH14]|uniref:DUF4084 domain-containing protein n=1 Tax=Peribacillus sp. TH14 TaxID=2798481 RepID=UPI001912C9B6|nr:DUF4084 domain-containing protein [Peribacillus sp. TH14]MBK5501387.1 DUF4084 domain-containing protein [Peribacillus sp. TH14]
MFQIKHIRELAIGLSFAYLLMYFIWILEFAHQNGEDSTVRVLFCVVAPLLAILFILGNIKKLSGDMKVFWTTVLVSCFNYLIAEIIWSFGTTYIGENDRFLKWVYLFWIVSLLCYSVSLLYKVYEKSEKYHILQLFFDVGIVMTVFITISWTYFVKLFIIDETVVIFGIILSVGYYVAHLGVIASIILILLTYRNCFSSRVLLLNISGMIGYAICNSIYLYQEMLDKYHSFSLMEPIWSACILLIGISSFFDDKTDQVNTQKENTKLFNISKIVFPYIGVVVLISFSIINKNEILSIFIGLLITLILILTRQIVTLWENEWLFKKLRIINQTLEEKVKKRTLELSLKNNQLNDLNQSLEEKVYLRTYELEETKSKLLASEQRYRSLFENHPDTVVLYDVNGEILQINNAELSYINSGCPIITLTLKEQANTIYFQRAIEGISQNFDVCIECEDDSKIDYTVTFVPVWNGDQIGGTFGVYQDITRKKRTEELLRKSEKLEIVSHLAASISHEVRNPLTVTKGFMQMLYNQVDAATQKGYLDIALKELDRAAEIINDYLMFAKPAIEQKEPIEAIKEIQQAVKVVMPLANMNAVQIIMPEKEDINQIVLGERKKFQQCLINIIKNSIEAMPDGGVLRIRVSSHHQSEIFINICDAGRGMKQEQIDRLGEPYFTTKEKGTGLGLMVSYSIIKGMDGNISVESKIDQGTCFSIQLPTTQPLNGSRTNYKKALKEGMIEE